MADFGNDGTRTIVGKALGGAKLRRSNGEADFLKYKLTAAGANPVFSLTSENNKIVWSNLQSPAPQAIYERKWPRDDSEIEGPDVMYTLLLVFFNCNKYTLVVNLCDKNDGILDEIKNIEYTSNDPTDSFPELMRVFIQ